MRNEYWTMVLCKMESTTTKMLSMNTIIIFNPGNSNYVNTISPNKYSLAL